MGMAFMCGGSGELPRIISKRLIDAGFERADSVCDARLVITYSASQAELEELYYGDAGFMQTLLPGAIMIDASPATPGFARELNAIATVSDLVFVEAPLALRDIVDPDPFARGNLLCFVSCETASIDCVGDVLDTLFSERIEAGGSGAAQLMRASHTIQATSDLLSAIEVGAMRKAFSRTLPDMSHHDTDSSLTGKRERILLAIDEERFDGPYSVAIFMSELSAALMAADDVDLIMPHAESAMHLLELLAVIGGSDKSPIALSLVYRDEESCARNGLDWSRAEKAFDDHDCCDEDHHCDHDDFGYGFDGFDFASN